MSLGFHLGDFTSREVVAATNATAAWLAFCVHVWAARNVSGKLRLMFITIATLALFYSCAYWWLFFNPDGVQDWSNALRPFGIITWVVAWSIEPVILVLYLRRRGELIVHRARVVAEEADERLSASEANDE